MTTGWDQELNYTVHADAVACNALQNGLAEDSADVDYDVPTSPASLIVPGKRGLLAPRPLSPLRLTTTATTFDYDSRLRLPRSRP